MGALLELLLGGPEESGTKNNGPGGVASPKSPKVIKGGALDISWVKDLISLALVLKCLPNLTALLKVTFKQFRGTHLITVQTSVDICIAMQI